MREKSFSKAVWLTTTVNKIQNIFRKAGDAEIVGLFRKKQQKKIIKIKKDEEFNLDGTLVKITSVKKSKDGYNISFSFKDSIGIAKFEFKSLDGVQLKSEQERLISFGLDGTQVSSYYVFTTKESKQLELIITPYKWIEIKCLHIPLFINLPILNK